MQKGTSYETCDIIHNALVGSARRLQGVDVDAALVEGQGLGIVVIDPLVFR